jgi:hypothetical protein
MLTAQKSLMQKRSEKIVFLGVFSLCFALGLSPYNDAFLIYNRKNTKNPKVQVI